MQDILKGLGGIIIYYIIETIIIAGAVSTVWILTLDNKVDIHLTYFDWFFVMFAFKIIRFDIFKFVNINNLPIKNKKENNNEI